MPGRTLTRRRLASGFTGCTRRIGRARRLFERHDRIPIVRADDEVRWIERRNSVSYDVDGHPKRVVGVSIDVTERKRAEERKRILLAKLDHRLKNALATVSSVVSRPRRELLRPAA